MYQIFTPGQTVYVIFWRRPEETECTRVTIYTTKRGRDNANIDLLTLGLITTTGTWKIPLPEKENMVDAVSKLSR
jgi:hypothetical protein